MADDARSTTVLERPALAPVLATVTDRSSDLDTTNITPCEGVMCSRCGGSGESDKRCGRCGSTGCYPCEAGCNDGWWPWVIETPSEALESLVARGVLPQSFADDHARAWWCSICKGKRTAYSVQSIRPTEVVLASPDPVPCFCVDEVPSLLDLLAWASLGAETIVAAEQLARETAARLRPWGVCPPVVRVTRDDGCVVAREAPWRIAWRVADPDALCGSTVPPRRGFPDAVLSHEDRQYSTWQDAYSEVMRALPSGSKAQSLGVAWARGIAAGYCAQWSDPRPNPYEPLHALLEMGLVLDALTDDALVVVVPPLGDSNG